MKTQEATGSPDSASMSYKAANFAIGAVQALSRQPITSTGLNRLHSDRPYILAFSHHNSHDVPAIGHLVYEEVGQPVHFMAKEELLSNKLSSWLLSSMHGIPVKKGGATISQTMVAIERLRAGNILGIAPEGERYDGDRISAVLRPIGRLAIAADVDIITIAVAGQNRRRRYGSKAGQPRVWLPRAMHVHIGEAISTQGLTKADSGSLDQLVKIALQDDLNSAYQMYKHFNRHQGAAAKLDYTDLT
jgi:1-acyl-sn-glycerol-3-phosphate acyltransferase